MTAAEGGAGQTTRRWIYLGILAVAIALAVWGGVVFHWNSVSSAASSKAAQLRTRLENAGLPAPDTQVIADSLGTDGGIVCQNPSDPLVKASYQAAISNGASGPGNRPVIGDSDVAEAVSLTIATYCPDNLGSWLKHVRDDLKLEDTTQS
jgi:hypothetical protein